MQRPHEAVQHVGDVMYRLFRQRVVVIIFIVACSPLLYQGQMLNRNIDHAPVSLMTT